jgi:uncharacterized membrane protein YbhN (UPF0104 family)
VAGRRLLDLVVLAALGFVMYQQRHDTLRALDMRLADFALILGCSLVMWILTSAVFCEMVRALGAPLPLSAMLVLHVASGLLNYLPARMGTLYRARYLKQRTGLSYTYFGSFSIVTMLIITAASGLVGALTVFVGYGLGGSSERFLFLAFLGLGVAGGLPLVFAPTFEGASVWKQTWNRLVAGRNLLLARRRTLVVMVAGHAAAFLFNALCYIGAFHTLGLSISPAACLVLGAVGRVAQLIGITPGGVGIQEFVVAAGAYLIGIPLATTVVAGTIIRAVLLIAYVALGVPALIALGRTRAPA